MFYAEFNEKGEITRERYFNRELKSEEINRLPNGQPALKKLILNEIPYDENTHHQKGFTYSISPDQVTKTPIIKPYTPDQLERRRQANLKELRKTSIKPYDESIEVITRVLITIADRLYMTYDPNDPRTENLVSKEDYEFLKSLHKTCETIK